MFTKKKSWLRFYSLDESVGLTYPILKSSDIERKYNGLAKNKERPESGNQTTANCPGIKKIVNSGYVLTAPMDFIIKTSRNDVNFSWEIPFFFNRTAQLNTVQNYTIPNSEYYVNFHSTWQTAPILPKECPHTNKEYLKTVVKVETPWRVKASNDIVLLQIPVAYNNEERFTAATGIVDPAYMHAIPVQLFWHITEGETLVKAGTPLVQYIPIKRELLEYSNIDLTVDIGGDVEQKLESLFLFANHARFPKYDSVINKVKTITESFKKFRERYPKSKI